MGTTSGPKVPARGTDPIHARHTAGGPTTSNVSKSVPDTQPPGTDRQLADAINSNSGHAARYEKYPEYYDKAPETAESPIQEDNKPGLAADSATVGMARHCGPRTWIPRNSGSLSTRRPIARVLF